MNKCLVGDCRDSMRSLIEDGIKVQTCVTSPPYFGLRDYGHPGQLGLEQTPQEYVANMVEVFRLVRELLSDDGTLWLNLGDSYAGSWGARGRGEQTNAPKPSWESKHGTSAPARNGFSNIGVKPKDLIGIPWRVAFALQADGWYLRQDIIWHKPNPMPESVTDRCTKSHEYIFMLSKSERYYYDNIAIKEPCALGDYKTPDGWDTSKGNGGHGSFHKQGREKGTTDKQRGHGRRHAGFNDRWDSMTKEEQCSGLRNKRSVWKIPTKPYSDAHFATFPPALIDPCILAGSRPGDIVFDPFLGSGTTAEVSQNLGRRWIGCELNHEYLNLQAQRTVQAGLILEAAV